MERDAAAGMVHTLCNRHEFLVALRAGPREKRTLVETLDVSRSTVDRALRELRAEGLVERESRGFVLTAGGRLAAALAEAILALTGDLRAAAQVLEPVPGDAPVDGRVVRGADVTLATRTTRYEPLAAVESLLGEATRVYGVAPVISQSRTLDLVAEAVTERDADVEIVFEESIATEHLPAVGEDVAAMVRNGFRPLSASDLPFGLLLGRTPAGWRTRLATYGDEGGIRGVISNDDPAAAAWAWDAYRTFRREAVDLTPAFVENRSEQLL